MQTFRYILFMLAIIGMGGFALAADPEAFFVDVSPSSFEPNTPVDVTVKAVKGNGEVVLDYEGDIYIDVSGPLDTTEYVVPSDHIYTFAPQDQGVKVFSKGLIIKKAGTYTLQISDLINDTIKGEKTLLVGVTSNENLKPIAIDSPMMSGIEKNEIINVFGNCLELPNSPFEIWLNNIPAAQGTTDANGSINGYVTGVQEGVNVLKVKILDINNIVLGESPDISFSYEPIADGVFNSIQVLPGAKLRQGEKATFIVSTNDSVTSVELKFSNAKSAPMDKESAGSFRKEVMMDTAGTIEVSADLILAGQKKTYTGIANLVVEKGTSIGKIRMFGDPVDKTALNVTREVIGEASKYKLLYGTGEDMLFQSATVSTNEILLQNLATGATYYFKIVPLDINGIEIGMPSAVVQAKVGELTEGGESCVVKGIIVSDTSIGDKYYLTRSGVLHASKYIIYRSDFETSDVTKMSKVAEVTDNRFEYPFNKNAKEEKFAYYVVEAVCTDGSTVIVDNVKKVQTGPVENILLFVIITIFIYAGYKLYKTSL